MAAISVGVSARWCRRTRRARPSRSAPNVTASKITSPLRKGEEVEVLRMAPEDACAKDMLVLVRWQDRKLAVLLAPTHPDQP
jgi:hypothetical protein